MGIALLDVTLDFDGAPHRLNRTGELCYHAVAGAAEHAATMVRNQPIDYLAVGVQGRERRFLIRLHETRVGHHIGSEYGGEASLHMFFPSA